MAKTTAKTTVQFKGVTYPFYRTIKGQWDFEQAGFTDLDVAAQKISALFAKTFFQLKDCAKRAGNPIKLTLIEFIEQADNEDDVVNGWERLVQAEKKLKEQEGSSEPGKPQPEETGAKN